MTAETLGASQTQTIQHAGGEFQTSHDKFLHELAQGYGTFRMVETVHG